MASMDASQWARLCRIEAASATHPPTRDFLLELAAEYEGISGEAVAIDPDDPMIQDAVADRLIAAARKSRASKTRKHEIPTL